jgi:hypothetical protein
MFGAFKTPIHIDITMSVPFFLSVVQDVNSWTAAMVFHVVRLLGSLMLP